MGCGEETSPTLVALPTSASLEAWQTCRVLRRPSVFLLLCLPACLVDQQDTG